MSDQIEYHWPTKCTVKSKLLVLEIHHEGEWAHYLSWSQAEAIQLKRHAHTHISVHQAEDQTSE